MRNSCLANLLVFTLTACSSAGPSGSVSAHIANDGGDAGSPSHGITQPHRHPTHAFDFDGDGTNELGTFRLGAFGYFEKTQDTLVLLGFGNPGDVPLASDYDGDGKTDYAVYRPSTRSFWWRRSSDQMLASIVVGDPGDVPIVADYDGDGKTDIALYQPDNARYAYNRSSDGTLRLVAMGSVGDLPVVGDFDGDGIDDFAVYTSALALFTYTRSSNAVGATVSLGLAGDTPVSGDYDGDGISDFAVYHAANATFTYQRSSDHQTASATLGNAGDVPLVGDFDGDGIDDIAVFRGDSGANHIIYRASSTNQVSDNGFGDPYDMPLDAARYQLAELAPSGTFAPSAASVQTMYQSGVPHTDRNGNVQTTYDAKSFLPECAYAAISGTFASMKAAGFNCAVPYFGDPLAQLLPEANQTGVQMIKEMLVEPCDFTTNKSCVPTTNAAPQIASWVTQVSAAANDPSVLGWYIEEEPTACLNNSNCDERFANYQAFTSAIRQVDSKHPIFDLDLSVPYASAQTEWNRWNSNGSIDVNDNYPFNNGTETTLATSVADYQQMVSLNAEKKPVWVTVQSFEQPTWSANWHWKMPTPQQLRAQVFAAVVHGATGIFYFAIDNWTVRDGQVIGIAPAAPTAYPGAPATDAIANASQIASSAAAWNQAVALNAELARLSRAILNPTAKIAYSVAVQGTGVSATPIRSLLKVDANGVYTMLVINIDNAPLAAQVTLPSRPYELYSIDANGARFSLAPYGNTFADTIEGFGVRVYEFKGL